MKRNKMQKIGLAMAFACVLAGSARAEGGLDPVATITAMQSTVLGVITALGTLIGALILGCTTLWVGILAYNRGRGATKSIK